MSFLTQGASGASLRIPEFRGLNQHGDCVGTDPRFAMEATGALTTQGVLRPMAKHTLLPPALESPIETLALLHRRWHTNPDERNVLIAASDGQLYWCLPDGQVWNKIALPQEWIGTRYRENNWSCVTYEINPEGSEAPVDVLLLSNALDGMICIRGDNMTASIVPTPKKFGVIARHAERIWGGAIKDAPDMLVYSAPYDPFDWAQNDDIPEDGAGDILQPSWDGDSFMALKTFGSQLMAFKRNNVWRILGTNPGEYIFSEQYGGGTSYANTVVVDGARILMLGRDGLLQYNGESVSPYYQEYACGVFRRMNRMALDKAFACMHGDVYYCALPLDESQDNNAVLLYNTVERTWLLRENVEVEAFLPTEDRLYYTSATTPGRVWLWEEDSMQTGAAVPMRWVSGWQDFSHQNMTKSGFSVYMTVECLREARLSISIQTEKKTKQKTVSFVPPADGKGAKHRMIRFGGSGRRFRVILESSGDAPWRLIGGMQIEAETDVD